MTLALVLAVQAIATVALASRIRRGGVLVALAGALLACSVLSAFVDQVTA